MNLLGYFILLIYFFLLGKKPSEFNYWSVFTCVLSTIRNIFSTFLQEQVLIDDESKRVQKRGPYNEKPVHKMFENPSSVQVCVKPADELFGLLGGLLMTYF